MTSVKRARSRDNEHYTAKAIFYAFKYSLCYTAKKKNERGGEQCHHDPSQRTPFFRVITPRSCASTSLMRASTSFILTHRNRNALLRGWQQSSSFRLFSPIISLLLLNYR